MQTRGWIASRAGLVREGRSGPHAARGVEGQLLHGLVEGGELLRDSLELSLQVLGRGRIRSRGSVQQLHPLLIVMQKRINTMLN